MWTSLPSQSLFCARLRDTLPFVIFVKNSVAFSFQPTAYLLPLSCPYWAPTRWSPNIVGTVYWADEVNKVYSFCKTSSGHKYLPDLIRTTLNIFFSIRILLLKDKKRTIFLNSSKLHCWKHARYTSGIFKWKMFQVVVYQRIMHSNVFGKDFTRAFYILSQLNCFFWQIPRISHESYIQASFSVQSFLTLQENYVL